MTKTGTSIEELGRSLHEALHAQNDLATKTSALESQLKAEQLRNTLAAAVVENQRLRARLDTMRGNRQQLLGTLPMQLGPEGLPESTSAGQNRRRSSWYQAGTTTKTDLTARFSTRSASQPDVVHMSDSGRADAMCFASLPRPTDNPGGAADVLTFGAVAASRLPPKRRPELQPRLLEQLLNGMEIPVEPRIIDRRVGGQQVGRHWEPTADPRGHPILPAQLMDPGLHAPPHVTEVKDIKYAGPFA